MGDYKHGPLHTPGAWGSVRVSGVPRGGPGAGPAVVIEAHGSGLYLPRAGSLMQEDVLNIQEILNMDWILSDVEE